MHRLSFNISVAHVNHGLRNKESDLDESFVKSECDKIKVPFYSTNIKDALSSSKGNLQENARILRYAYFKTLKDELKTQWILTAHHQDDSIETMTHHFFRGSGLDGLIGIQAKSGFIVRPLLCFNKREIRSLATQHAIAYREDSSNQLDKYKRNYIRHQILDSKDSLFDHQRARLYTTLDNLQRTSKLTNYLMSRLKEELLHAVNDRELISIDKLSMLEHQESILYELLKEYGFNSSQCQDLCLDLNITGRKIESKTHQVVIERGFIKVLKRLPANNSTLPIYISKKNNSYPLDGLRTLRVSFSPKTENDIKKKDLVLDADKLVFPLILRKWGKGDVFYPSGMNGKSQKISKALRNYRVESSAKASQFVLISKNEICALIPYRTAEPYKVDTNSHNIMRVELIES
jgi:tRNA(Ile)-lysidine synthase